MSRRDDEILIGDDLAAQIIGPTVIAAQMRQNAVLMAGSRSGIYGEQLMLRLRDYEICGGFLHPIDKDLVARRAQIVRQRTLRVTGRRYPGDDGQGMPCRNRPGLRMVTLTAVTRPHTVLLAGRRGRDRPVGVLVLAVAGDERDGAYDQRQHKKSSA